MSESFNRVFDCEKEIKKAALSFQTGKLNYETEAVLRGLEQSFFSSLCSCFLRGDGSICPFALQHKLTQPRSTERMGRSSAGGFENLTFSRMGGFGVQVKCANCEASPAFPEGRMWTLTWNTEALFWAEVSDAEVWQSRKCQSLIYEAYGHAGLEQCRSHSGT